MLFDWLRPDELKYLWNLGLRPVYLCLRVGQLFFNIFCCLLILRNLFFLILMVSDSQKHQWNYKNADIHDQRIVKLTYRLNKQRWYKISQYVCTLRDTHTHPKIFCLLLINLAACIHVVELRVVKHWNNHPRNKTSDQNKYLNSCCKLQFQKYDSQSYEQWISQGPKKEAQSILHLFNILIVKSSQSWPQKK